MAETVDAGFVEEFDALMQSIVRTFHTSGSSHLDGLDITIQQFVVLQFIRHKNDPKMTDLAESLGVTMGNMTMMTDRLIKEGYVVREDDPADRRVVRVCLTAKGKDLIKKAEEKKKKHMQELLSKLNREDRKSLKRIIEKIVEEIKKEKGEN